MIHREGSAFTVDCLVEVEPGRRVTVFAQGTVPVEGDLLILRTEPPRWRAAEVYADRHAATPGQLITYMTGYLEIVNLREQARRELGSAFDLRAFHDVVLDDGPVTLPMLRAKVERWIASAKTGGA